MKKLVIRVLSAITLVMSYLSPSQAVANTIGTLVQFSTDGTGTGVDGSYNVTGVNEFDWQSSGDLVIPDNLPGTGSVAGGVLYDSFTLWSQNAVVGDTLTFDIHAHSLLHDMLNSGGSSVAPPNLSVDGGLTNIGGAACDGTNCFEITYAADATYSATLTAPNTLAFTSITGTFEAFYDTLNFSTVTGGTGFNDGTGFLSGTLECAITGNCGNFTSGVGGSAIIGNSITNYDNSFIEVDPSAGVTQLAGATFDSLISLLQGGEATVGVGGTIGVAPYTVQADDVTWKINATSEFSASTIPIPGAFWLFGSGLLGLLGISRRKKAA